MTAALLKDLERHRTAFAERLDGLDPEVVHAAPRPGAWSLAQLAEHFARIDAGLDLDGPPAAPLARATSRARASLLCAVLSLPVRIPAPPSARGVMPSADPRWPTVRESWATLRAGWSVGAVKPGRVAYRHPLLGPFLLDDALRFLRAHHRHHDAQVRRTLARVRGDGRRVTSGMQTPRTRHPAPPVGG